MYIGHLTWRYWLFPGTSSAKKYMFSFVGEFNKPKGIMLIICHDWLHQKLSNDNFWCSQSGQFIIMTTILVYSCYIYLTYFFFFCLQAWMGVEQMVTLGDGYYQWHGGRERRRLGDRVLCTGQPRKWSIYTNCHQRPQNTGNVKSSLFYYYHGTVTLYCIISLCQIMLP